MGNAYNYLDIFGNGFIIKTTMDLYVKGAQVYSSHWSKFYLIVGLLVLGLRALSQLRMFTKFSVLIELIKQTLLDMVYFIAIISVIMNIICLGHCLIKVTGDKTFDQENIWFIYPKFFGEFYQTILGENPEGGEISGLEWGLYVIFTILINITTMNLLIAILSNTYDNVMASLYSSLFKTKVEILNELQDLMFWNRGKNELQYLHFVYYAFEDLNPNNKNGDEWEGRVRAMMTKIQECKEMCKVSVREMENLKGEIKADLRQVWEQEHHNGEDLKQFKQEIQAD